LSLLSLLSMLLRPCLQFVCVLSVVLLLSPLLSGCVRAHAKAVPDMPSLDVPAPPPRAIEPLEADAAPPKPEEPTRAAAPARPRPTPARTEPQPPARTEPQPPARTEPQPTDPPKVAEEPPKVAEEPPKPAAPPPTLQTTPAAAESAVERAIRATLARATSDLNRVDYRALNVDARTQYDTAKRFIEQSDEAIRTKNLVFAKNLADKAAALGAQLAGR
jgi:outer membrane biosynthesis protein TonB